MVEIKGKYRIQMENAEYKWRIIQYKWKIVEYKWKIIKYKRKIIKLKWTRSNIATADIP
jgi:hypothetical protein